eukprot:1073575-Pyramimonas_sp.AAC.1
MQLMRRCLHRSIGGLGSSSNGPQAGAGHAGVALEICLHAPPNARLWDHRVLGRALFPGVGYLEVGLKSTPSAGESTPSA